MILIHLGTPPHPSTSTRKRDPLQSMGAATPSSRHPDDTRPTSPCSPEKARGGEGRGTASAPNVWEAEGGGNPSEANSGMEKSGCRRSSAGPPPLPPPNGPPGAEGPAIAGAPGRATPFPSSSGIVASTAGPWFCRKEAKRTTHSIRSASTAWEARQGKGGEGVLT